MPQQPSSPRNLFYAWYFNYGWNRSTECGDCAILHPNNHHDHVVQTDTSRAAPEISSSTITLRRTRSATSHRRTPEYLTLIVLITGTVSSGITAIDSRLLSTGAARWPLQLLHQEARGPGNRALVTRRTRRDNITRWQATVCVCVVLNTEVAGATPHYSRPIPH